MDCNVYIRELDSIDSTNRYTRENSGTLWHEAQGKEIIAVTARHQTAGRGQRGNTWDSAADSNLLLTLIVRPGNSLEAARQFLLSQTVAVAIHAAMKSHGIYTRLKWPNDIYAGNRKLAGILVELDYSGKYIEQAIIGIGLNVNQTEFPPMERTPVSMKMLTGKETAISEVLHSLLREFTHYYSTMRSSNADAIAAEYKGLLLGLGQERSFIDTDGMFTATIEGTEPDGHLLLRRTDGSLSHYAFKEVEQLIQ